MQHQMCCLACCFCFNASGCRFSVSASNRSASIGTFKQPPQLGVQDEACIGNSMQQLGAAAQQVLPSAAAGRQDVKTLL